MAWTNSPSTETWTVEKSHPVSIAIRVEDRLRNDIAQTADRMWLTVRSDNFKLDDDTDSTALIAVESGPPIINPRGHAFLLTIQADQLDLDPEEMYWYDITYSRDNYPLSILKGRFIVSPNVTNRAEDGPEYDPVGNIYEYVAVLHNQSIVNVTASLPLPLQGVEGLSTFITTASISTVLDASTNVPIGTIRSIGRPIQEGDILMSSNAATTGVFGEVTSLNYTGGTLTSVTVRTAARTPPGPVGPAGPQGIQGPRGPAGLEPIDMVSTDAGNMLSLGTDGKLAVLPNVLLSALPIGSILMWPNNAAPPGWLFCHGQIFNAIEYPALAAVLSTTFGGTAASPRTPNLQRRHAVGRDTAAGNPNLQTLGAAVGQETVALNSGHLPAHAHAVPPITGQTGDQGAHTHSINHTHPPFNTGLESGHTHTIPNHVHTMSHYHVIDPPLVGTSFDGAHTHDYTLRNRTDVYRTGGDANAIHNSIGSNISFPTASAGRHQHMIDAPAFNSAQPSTPNTGNPTSLPATSAGSSHQHPVTMPAFNGTSGLAGGHSHTLNIPGGVTGSTGGNTPVPVREPAIVLNYIIKAV